MMKQKRIAIKNTAEEVQLITQRSIVGLMVMLVLIVLLILRLGYLQIIKNDLYTTLSNKNSLDLVPLEPTRGLIFDRNGILLADNVPVFSLDIVPSKVDNIRKTITEVSKIIPLDANDVVAFEKQLKQHRRFEEIPLKLRLTEDEVARFSENQYRFPGVFIKARLMRHYPYGVSFSHVLGYVGRINTQELEDIDTANYSATNYIGKLGVEKYYEDELHGTVGVEQAENNASGEAVRILKQNKPTPGKNIYLTIDSRLQLIAEQAMGNHRGAIVAIQPKTGQILAMVSQPGFDPNIFVQGVSLKQFKELQNADDRPLYNRALRGVYPLASTIKPYLALKALEEELITPADKIVDPGWFKLANSGHIFFDWRKHGHGVVNIERAITVSCDTFFYNLSSRLGIQRIDEILTEFGFGESTGIDLDDELTGNVATPEWKKRIKGLPWFPGDTVNTAIGQGFMLATPLQLAVAVSTLANRGVHMVPTILLGQQQPNQNYIPKAPQQAGTVAIENKFNLDLVLNGMTNVVASTDGTAYRFGKVSYTVAAKTGTAQVFSKKHEGLERPEDNQMALPEKLRDHHLLIVFAPVDDPQIAVAIITENSYETIPIARKMLDYYLLQKKGPSNGTQRTSESVNKKTDT